MSSENQRFEVVIEPRRGVIDINIAHLWRYRELLYFLIWRDVQVRYKQTVIGVAWAILQPLLAMIIFTVIFGNFAKMPSDNLPYPIFTYSAMLPWQLFAQAINLSTTSVVSNSSLVTKVYFPRLYIPLAAVTTPVVDFFWSFLVLIGMMVWFGIAPSWAMLTLPLFVLLALLTALAVGLWLSALNVQYRDVGHAIPFIVQAWMYASPVIYSVAIIPEHLRLLYGLNPMAGVIEGFRWALLGKTTPDFGLMGLSAVFVLVLLIGGLIYFQRAEDGFADLI